MAEFYDQYATLIIWLLFGLISGIALFYLKVDTDRGDDHRYLKGICLLFLAIPFGPIVLFMVFILWLFT